MIETNANTMSDPKVFIHSFYEKQNETTKELDNELSLWHAPKRSDSFRSMDLGL